MSCYTDYPCNRSSAVPVPPNSADNLKFTVVKNIKQQTHKSNQQKQTILWKKLINNLESKLRRQTTKYPNGIVFLKY